MDQSPPRLQQAYSRDGTAIGFVTRGVGPGVVLVQGAMADASHFSELAEALSDTFTVHAVDRRGRGLSPRPYATSHTIARDVEDVDAVLAATGAGLVFGLSSGAVIALEAARTLSRVQAVAVFEPPVPRSGVSTAGIRRVHSAIDRGDLGAAMVEAMLTAGTAPAPLRHLPRPISHILGRAVLAVDDRGHSTRTRLRSLVPGVRYDFHDVAEVDARTESLTAITVPVLLLNGTRSPAFLRRSTECLLGLLPAAEHAAIPGLSHSGPWNRSRGGHPDLVADELLRAWSPHNRP